MMDGDPTKLDDLVLAMLYVDVMKASIRTTRRFCSSGCGIAPGSLRSS